MPVIVVGNITVGGTGKTPLVIAMVDAVQRAGFKPGIILRGYHGKSRQWPCIVTQNSDPRLVGDEAVLLAIKTNAPIVSGKNRAADCKMLLEHFECDVIISDDGLQHYALARDVEIAVVDGDRQFGNGFCLPAGPLREPVSRLNTVDVILTNGESRLSENSMTFVLDDIVSVRDPHKKLPEHCHGSIIAIAGIGNPDRFFKQLRDRHFVFETRCFPDHHSFCANDLLTLSCDVILMTEKDAIKCRSFVDERCYVVQGHADIQGKWMAEIIKKLMSS